MPRPGPRLPAYEPPACPLDEAARRALADLANGRGTRFYEAQLKDLVRQLGLGVGDMHERLADRLERLDALRARRRDRVAPPTDDEARLERHLLAFEPDVDALTRQSEAAVRHAIDRRAELEDETAVLSDLYTAVATRAVDAAAARRREKDGTDDGADDDDGDDDNPPDRKPEPPAPSTLDAFRELRARKLAEYHDRLTPAQRYAHNDYAGFKKLWHDAAAGENGPALPDASRWFRPDGQPVMDRPGAAARRSAAGADGDDDDDDDDEVAVAREVLSLNCPLTLRPMDEPYSNGKCKHTFEKSAILDYLPAQGSVQCPQTGCSQTFSRASFAQDFFLDQAVLRRIRRAGQVKPDADLDNEDEQDHVDRHDDGDDVSVDGQRAVRARGPKAERLSEG